MSISLLQSLATKIAAGRIGRALNSILNYRYFFRRVRHYISDTKIHAELSRVDRYRIEPEGNLDMDLFQEISEISDTVQFDAIDNNQNILRIRGENIPAPLEIRIEPMPTFENGSQQISRYEVVVKTYTDITFGYRSSDSLTEFRNLSEDIAGVIQNRILIIQTRIIHF